MLLPVALFHSFLWLSNIPLYIGLFPSAVVFSQHVSLSLLGTMNPHSIDADGP